MDGIYYWNRRGGSLITLTSPHMILITTGSDRGDCLMRLVLSVSVRIVLVLMNMPLNSWDLKPLHSNWNFDTKMWKTHVHNYCIGTMHIMPEMELCFVFFLHNCWVIQSSNFSSDDDSLFINIWWWVVCKPSFLTIKFWKKKHNSSSTKRNKDLPTYILVSCKYPACKFGLGVEIPLAVLLKGKSTVAVFPNTFIALHFKFWVLIDSK